MSAGLSTKPSLLGLAWRVIGTVCSVWPQDTLSLKLSCGSFCVGRKLQVPDIVLHTVRSLCWANECWANEQSTLWMPECLCGLSALQQERTLHSLHRVLHHESFIQEANKRVLNSFPALNKCLCRQIHAYGLYSVCFLWWSEPSSACTNT